MGTAQSFAGMARTLAPLVATSLFATAGRVVPFVGGAIIAGVVLVLSGRIEDAGGARPVAKPLEEEPAEAD
jgi:hypothetical protein